VPESDALDASSWREVETIVARALGARPASVRRQLAAFVRLLSVVALVRYRRTFTQLTQAERFMLLDSLSRSRLLLVRRGVWGLRTLAFMGYYARPAAADAIGYRASAAGWAARTSPPAASSR
jgi:hypothetical protein